MTTNTNGNGTGYDFSYLYNTETVDIFAPNGDVAFTVTVRDIPHGEFAKNQDQLIKSLPNVELVGKKQKIEASMNRGVSTALKNGQFSTADYKDKMTLLGIQSWTLKSNGEIVPITLDVYHLLPHAITEQIEDAVERLNPEMDEEFQGESGDADTA